MSTAAIYVADLDRIEWTPASKFAAKMPIGQHMLYQGQDVFYQKVLSDRRKEGGGRAVLQKISPPPGKVVKIISVARSEEHIFRLRGGRVDKAGKLTEALGNAYTLNPTGHPHSSMIATETISLVVYSGEGDDVKSIEIVDFDPAVDEVE